VRKPSGEFKKVPDDTHCANLAQLGQNGEPVGGKPAFRMMLMMCQNFNDALEDADSANASTSTDKQVMRQLQRKEFHSSVFTGRAACSWNFE
jgi:hypothetical protein